METVSLRCNECGGSLSIPPGTNFVTCSYCNASLQVKHAGGAHFTALADKVQRIEQNLGVVELQNRLERLDREWEMRRRTLQPAGGDGRAQPAGKAMTQLVGFIVVGFGIFWTIMTVQMGAPIFMTLFGLFFVGMGIVQTIRMSGKMDQLQREERAYQAERATLVAELERRR